MDASRDKFNSARVKLEEVFQTSNNNYENSMVNSSSNDFESFHSASPNTVNKMYTNLFKDISSVWTSKALVQGNIINMDPNTKKISVNPEVKNNFSRYLKDSFIGGKVGIAAGVADFLDNVFEGFVEGNETGDWSLFHEQAKTYGVQTVVGTAIFVAVAEGAPVAATAIGVPALGVVATNFLYLAGAFHVGYAVGSLMYKTWDYWRYGRRAKPSFDEAESNASPLVIDLDGDGVKTVALKDSAVQFDLDGNDFAENSAWLDRNDAFLALDKNGNGKIDGGAELFGNHTVLKNGAKASDGIEALAAYDDNGDGVIDAKDAVYDSLLLWRDKNGNGVSEADELQSLREAGVASIDLRADVVNEVDEAGNLITHRGSVRLDNGELREMLDVWFKTDPTRTKVFHDVDVPSDILELPNVYAFGNVLDLHVAMAQNSLLKDKVLRYLNAGADQRIPLLEDLIYEWTGSAQVLPNGRGGNIDARKLVALEALVGRDYNQIGSWGKNPGPNASKILEEEFAKFASYVQGVLLLSDRAEAHLGAFRWVSALEGDASLVLERFAEELLLLGQSNALYAQELYQIFYDCLRYEPSLQTQFVDYFLNYERDDFSRLGIGPAHTVGDGGDNLLHGNARLPGFYGSGDDVLRGGNGNDVYVLQKFFGKDRIINYDMGANRHDEVHFLEGVSSEDFVYRRYGNDLYLTAKYGPDELIVVNYFVGDGVGGHQVDLFRFADGTTLGVEEIKRLVQEPSMGNDELHAYQEGNRLNGLDGDDAIFGYGGNDVLGGGKGNDRIVAGAGDDVLDGGDGDDFLVGGAGNDVYVFKPYFGQDVIDHSASQKGDYDLIVFQGSDDAPEYLLNPEDFSFARDDRDLLVCHKESGDQITIKHYFGNEGEGAAAPINIRFANGEEYDFAKIRSILQQSTPQNDAVYGYSDSDYIDAGDGDDVVYGYGGDDTLIGGNGNDQLHGGKGNDSLRGGKGDDRLVGGEGADFYYYQLGDGNDTIYCHDGKDSLVLEGISQGDVRATRSGRALILEMLDGAIICVENHFDVFNDARGLKEIVFVDGTWDRAVIEAKAQQGTPQNDTIYAHQAGSVLDGGDGDDVLIGALGNDTLLGGKGKDNLQGAQGDDVLVGGKGDDVLIGGQGNDRYHYRLGDGNDVILSHGNQKGDQDRDQDQLYFDDLMASDVVAKRDNQDLILQAINGQKITLEDYFVNDGDSLYTVFSIHFADGTLWDIEKVKVLVQQSTPQNDTIYAYQVGSVLDGGDGDDVLIGALGNDTLLGGKGKDHLQGDQGDDVLVGGKGDDVLKGGQGDDHYYYQKGDGKDIIDDNFGKNQLYLQDIKVEDLIVGKDGDALILRFKGRSNDLITINYPQNIYKLHIDGQIWTQEYIDYLAQGGTFSTAPLPIKNAPLSIIAGLSFTANLNNYFEDPEQDLLHFVIENAPEWLEYDPVTGEMTGKAPLNLHMYDLNIQAQEPHTGLSATNQMQIQILENQAPQILKAYPNLIFNEEQNISHYFDLSVIQNPEKAEVLQISLMQSDGSALPTWLSFDSKTGHLQGKPPKGAQALDLRIKIHDQAGQTTEDYFTLQINTAPTHKKEPLPAQYIEAGQEWTYFLPTGHFIDLETGALHYEVQFNQQNKLPDWINHNQEHNALHANVPITQEDFTLQIKATDAHGLSTVDVVQIYSKAPDQILNAPWNGGVVVGQSGNDTINGSWFKDRLEGGAGDDTLNGKLGNDVLVGGRGNDVLNGGLGNDEYHYQKGDGKDIIIDQGGRDTLKLVNYEVVDFSIKREGNDLLLKSKENIGDEITIKDYFKGDRIEKFEFSDKTLSDKELLDYLLALPDNSNIII